MKINLLVVVCVMLFIHSGFAQICTPGQFTSPGLYPDSTQGLPDATPNVQYTATMTAVVPPDTTIYNPGIGFITLPINYTRIDSIIGLPQGFTYACEPSNCQFPGGSSGCILISGQSQTQGYYDFIIYSTTNVTHPILGATDAPQSLSHCHVTVGSNLNLPVAQFTIPATGFTGQSISPINNSTFATSYSWSFPGGSPNSSSLPNPSTVYSSPGTYTVTLTATNNNGNDTYQASIIISDPNVSTLFSPDCQTGLAHALTGAPYNQSLTVTVPADTSMYFAGVGNITLTVNYLSIDSIHGLPPGITYTCNPADCHFPGGGSGTITFSGQATSEGVFPFTVYNHLNVAHQVLGIFDTTPDSVMCQIISELTVGSSMPNTLQFQLFPNPNNGNFTVEMLLAGSSPVTGTLRNIMGQTVYSFNGNANKGVYKKNIEPGISPGIYYFTLQTNEGIITKKIDIVR